MAKLEMNLVDYLRVIRKRKRIIFLSFILIVVSTFLFTRRQTPIYSSSCKVKIEQRKSVAEILTELVTWAPGDAMASQANIITSFDIMEKVAERLTFLPDDLEDEARNARIKALQSQIEAEQVGYTNIIQITATTKNPDDAQKLANTVAEVYKEAHHKNKIQEASNLKEFVRNQLDIYRSELQAAEIELQRFRQENPLIVERDLKSISPLEASPRIESLEREVIKIELELISSKSKYTEEHPEVITTQRKLDKARNDLSRAIRELTNQQKEFSSKEIELIQLKRNVNIAEDLFLMFRTKYAEARILEAEKAEDVSIIEPAILPTKPIKPNVSFNILIGIISGLLIGLVVAFVTESFDTSIGRIDDIEELIKVPVLGIIPNTSLEKGKKRYLAKFKRKEVRKPEEGISKERLVTLFDPSSIASEAYKSLRTNIDLTGLKKLGNCIVITSAAPQEGKTQTLCNLAISFAQSGQKTLIVGSDFRKPMIHKLFGLPRSPGLSEILIGNIPWKKAVNTITDMLLGNLEYEKILKAQGIENLHVITCGEHTPSPSELLSFQETSELIKEFRQNYDLILLDSAPILPVTDSAILGAKADGAIIVYQAGKTSRNALIRAKIQLENVKVKILGIVINNIKAQYIEDITPDQKYRYYRYYGEKKTKETTPLP